MSETPQYTDRFAEDDDEADKRYTLYRSIDPFPEIKPALLNSADLEDYVAATGMIVPFSFDGMKPASCGIKIGGKCVYWNENDERQTYVLANNAVPGHDGLIRRGILTLRPNSITYVPMLPTFRLPEYIAMRFNLTIQNVYRGLLLGTGPLVDPGFYGKLWFPLHNLTNEEYVLNADEVIIYAEFTKLSHWTPWNPPGAGTAPPSRVGQYVPFDPEKLMHRTDIDDYLYHASGGHAITSSVQPLVSGVRVAREAAQRAADDADESQKTAREITDHTRVRVDIAAVGVILTTIAGAVAIYLAVAQLAGETKTEVAAVAAYTSSELSKHEASISSLKSTLDGDRTALRDIEHRIRDLSDELSQITGKVDSKVEEQLSRKLDEFKGQLDEIRKQISERTQKSGLRSGR